MESNSLANIFRSFDGLPVLIIGDAMIDHYVFGEVNRISPEAPVPIVDVTTEEDRLGGAANVALNVKALGGNPILATVVGDDKEGHLFKSILHENGIESSYVILDLERQTTVKTRVISGSQQLMRYDRERAATLDEKTEILFLDNIIEILYNQRPQVVIFQDYNKGVLTPKVIANVIHQCEQAKIPVAVDPKFDNFFAYKGCTLFKPNLRETATALEIPNMANLLPNVLPEADQMLREELSHMYSVITLSEKGLFVGAGDDYELIPSFHRTISDVSGAGDTVISLMALGLALNLDVFAIAELANIAAGLVCEKIGVVPIDRDRLIEVGNDFFN